MEYVGIALALVTVAILVWLIWYMRRDMLEQQQHIDRINAAIDEYIASLGKQNKK